LRPNPGLRRRAYTRSEESVQIGGTEKPTPADLASRDLPKAGQALDGFRMQSQETSRFGAVPYRFNCAALRAAIKCP